MRIVVIGEDENKLYYDGLNNLFDTIQLSFVDVYHDLTQLSACDFIILDTTIMLEEVIERLASLKLFERTLVMLDEENRSLIGPLLARGVKDVYFKPVQLQELAAKLEGFNNILRHPIFMNSRYGLSLKQQKIFELLKAQRTDGVTRTDVLKTVWPEQQVSEKSVDVHIYNLRRSLNPFNLKIEHQSNRWYLVG